MLPRRVDFQVNGLNSVSIKQPKVPLLLFNVVAIFKRIELYPLIPCDAIPLTMCFCSTKNSIITTIEPKTPPTIV